MNRRGFMGMAAALLGASKLPWATAPQISVGVDMASGPATAALTATAVKADGSRAIMFTQTFEDVDPDRMFKAFRRDLETYLAPRANR